METIRTLLSYIIPSLAPPAAPPITLRGPNHNRYPTTDEYNYTYTLPDGRTLGYSQYGSLTGKPIFFCHGLPGSRIEGAYFHELGVKYGARIISTDRPGVGLSSPHPGRKLLDFPKDIENLANHLKLSEYAVMGASGGGPTVLACAYALPPSQLKCASLICCIGPSDIIGHKGGAFGHKLGFPYGWRYGSRLTMRYIKTQTICRTDLPAEERVRRMLAPSVLAKHPPQDLDIMKDEETLWTMIKSADEGYGHSIEGEAQDGRITCSPWGFKIADIRKDLPVQMWYGRLDMNVPISHGDYIAAQLGGRAEYHISDDTHTSVFFNRKEDAIKEALKKF